MKVTIEFTLDSVTFYSDDDEFDPEAVVEFARGELVSKIGRVVCDSDAVPAVYNLRDANGKTIGKITRTARF